MRQLFTQHLLGQEIFFKEVGNAFTDPVLVAGNDCGMRNRQAKRTAKQRRHGKPVRQRPDHRGFGESADIG